MDEPVVGGPDMPASQADDRASMGGAGSVADREPADPELASLHPELRARVLAATGQAQLRLVDGPGPDGEYEVYGLTGDRVVHMVLSMDPSGSVNEATQTFVRGQITGLSVTDDRADVEVDEAGGRRAVSIPAELARALIG